MTALVECCWFRIVGSSLSTKTEQLQKGSIRVRIFGNVVVSILSYFNFNCSEAPGRVFLLFKVIAIELPKTTHA